MDTAKIVDARGSYCPGPLMELIKGIRREAIGTTLEIWSSDRGSAKDIPEWAARAGHELVSSTEEDGIYKIQVRKAR